MISVSDKQKCGVAVWFGLRVLQARWWSELHSSEGLTRAGESTSELSPVAVGWSSFPYHMDFSTRGMAAGFPSISGSRKREQEAEMLSITYFLKTHSHLSVFCSTHDE